MKTFSKLLGCLGKSPQTCHDAPIPSGPAALQPPPARMTRETGRMPLNLRPLRRVARLSTPAGATAAAMLAAGESQARGDPVNVFQHPDIRFGAPTQQRIQPEHRRLTLVTRWASKPRETAKENDCYGHFMADSIERTAIDLSNGRIGNLFQLWQRARAARLESFLLQKKVRSPGDLTTTSDLTFYRDAGMERLSGILDTEMGDRYQYIVKSIQAQAQAVIENGQAISKFRSIEDGEPSLGKWIDGDVCLTYFSGAGKLRLGDYMLYIRAPGNQNGEPRLEIAWSFAIPESRGERSDFARNPAVHDMKLHNRVWDANPDTVCFAETGMYAPTNALFAKALKATERSDILDHAFEGYWNLVVIAPDVRGSAAKSHYVLQSILLSKGIELPPARDGLAPDLEAMARTRHAWVAHAREVFGIT